MLAIHNDIKVKNEEILDTSAQKSRKLDIFLKIFVVFSYIVIKKMV